MPFTKYSDVSIQRLQTNNFDGDCNEDGHSTSNLNTVTMDTAVSSEIYHDAVDLHDAPTLDLRECAESESAEMDAQNRMNEDMSFWNQQPPSPKKQSAVSDDVHSFGSRSRSRSGSKVKSEVKDNDDAVHSVHASFPAMNKLNGRYTVKLEPIPSPNCNGSSLPIPDEFEGNFKFMNPTNLPSKFSIITPRREGLERKEIETDPQTECNDEHLRNGMVLDSPTLTTPSRSDHHNDSGHHRELEDEERYEIDRQMEQLIALKSRYSGNRKTVPSPRASRKQKSREWISSSNVTRSVLKEGSGSRGKGRGKGTRNGKTAMDWKKRKRDRMSRE